MNKNIGIISQARMTSTRLPGKVLLKANGKTVLEHHIHRLAWSNVPAYLATTVNGSDDPLIELAKKCALPFYRGDEHDVLERYFQCASAFKLDVIIRVTSDCPLVDGHIIAEGLAEYLKLNDQNVYYSNCLTRTFPRGLDFEIFSFPLLQDAFMHAVEPAEREHVTPYINQNKSGVVKIKDHVSPENFSDLRWTLDTVEDWSLLKMLFEVYQADDLKYNELLDIIRQNPELASVNKLVKQKEL
jgi:spore coat polysaccharide biosynthesis protein SpsF